MPYQIVGEPEWFDSERYDLTARAEEGVMLGSRESPQRLMAELKVHRESKEFSGFALVVAKRGFKLKESGETLEQSMVYPGGMRLPHATLDWLAAMLITPARRPVVNKTGIAGNYDIELTYAKEATRIHPSRLYLLRSRSD